MKNLLLFWAFLLIVVVSPLSGQVRFGGRLGIHGNNIYQNYKSPHPEYATKILPGFHIGVVADYRFNNHLGLQPGLLYTVKGYQFDMEHFHAGPLEYEGYFHRTYKYIEIPLNLVFRQQSFLVYAGPYFSVGVGGRDRYDYTYSPWVWNGETLVQVEENIKGKMKYRKPVLGSARQEDYPISHSVFNIFDYGINLGAGYQWKNNVITGGYSLGLGNIRPTITTGTGDPPTPPATFYSAHRVLSVAITRFFGQPPQGPIPCPSWK